MGQWWCLEPVSRDSLGGHTGSWVLLILCRGQGCHWPPYMHTRAANTKNTPECWWFKVKTHLRPLFPNVTLETAVPGMGLGPQTPSGAGAALRVQVQHASHWQVWTQPRAPASLPWVCSSLCCEEHCRRAPTPPSIHHTTHCSWGREPLLLLEG